MPATFYRKLVFKYCGSNYRWWRFLPINYFGCHQKNEDAFACVQKADSLWILVADGSTSLAPISLIEDKFNITAARFASHFIASQLPKLLNEQANDTQDAIKLLKLLNQRLFRECEGLGLAIDLGNPYTMPMTTATLVKIDSRASCLSIAHIGDGFACTKSSLGETNLHTSNMQRASEEVIFERMKNIAATEGITVREARTKPAIVEELLTVLKENYCKPDGRGFGVLNGFQSAEQYMQKTTISLADVDELFIGTDGIVPLSVSEENESGRKKIFDVLNERGVPGLIRAVKATQDEDLDWIQEPRWKHSDDATGVFIKFLSETSSQSIS